MTKLGETPIGTIQKDFCATNVIVIPFATENSGTRVVQKLGSSVLECEGRV